MAIARSLHTHPVSRPDRRAARHLLALPAALLFGMVILAAAYIAYVLWPRWPAPPIAADAPSIPVIVADVSFNVPPAAIRQRVQRRPGTHERLDLAFLWPSLRPPDPAARLAPAVSARAVDRVFVSIIASASALAPADRVRTIYPRYLDTRISAGPGGLAVRPFRDGTPYQGEELIYDSGSVDGFVTRCTGDGPGPTLGICLYDARIGSADITIRFPRIWLEDWRAVVNGLDQLIRSLRAGAH